MDDIKKSRFGDTEFKTGYVHALEGIMVSIRSGDERDFLNKAPLDKKSLNGYKKGFNSLVKDEINSPFDLGFFMAWSDLIQYKLEKEEAS